MPLGKYRALLKSFGFQSFLWTQFLGAFNDNVCKIVVSMLAVSMATADGGSVMFAAWKERLGLISLVLIAVAVAGTVASFGIGRVPSPTVRTKHSP